MSLCIIGNDLFSESLLKKLDPNFDTTKMYNSLSKKENNQSSIVVKYDGKYLALSDAKLFTQDDYVSRCYYKDNPENISRAIGIISGHLKKKTYSGYSVKIFDLSSKELLYTSRCKSKQYMMLHSDTSNIFVKDKKLKGQIERCSERFSYVLFNIQTTDISGKDKVIPIKVKIEDVEGELSRNFFRKVLKKLRHCYKSYILSNFHYRKDNGSNMLIVDCELHPDITGFISRGDKYDKTNELHKNKRKDMEVKRNRLEKHYIL